MKKFAEKKCLLLDMDGTIYLGNQLIDGAKDFLSEIRKLNKNYIFVTNNSSKDKKAYVEKLKGLGIEAEPSDIFGSGDATINYLLKKKKNPRVFLMGTKALESSFEEAGMELVRERDKEIDFVVLGFDTTLTYEKLWIACDYIISGVDYIATHPDFVCPLEGGKTMPDTGAMIELIKAATNGKTPTVIGKPNHHIVDGILERYNLKKEDLVMVGDRVYTDVRTGVENGITSVLVLSGESTMETVENSPIKPDYIFNSVKEMIEEL